MTRVSSGTFGFRLHCAFTQGDVEACRSILSWRKTNLKLGMVELVATFPMLELLAGSCEKGSRSMLSD